MRYLLPAAALCVAVPACAAVEPVDEAVAAATTGDLQLNLLYIHGVENSAGARAGAHNTLNDLKAAVAADLPSLIASYQAGHPGVMIHAASASANLYTATPSGIHPSDSTDPTLMDDWEVGDPGCASTRQGDPCTTAYEWRFRLVQEIRRLFPPTARNIVLISTSSPVPFNGSTPTFSRGGACPVGDAAISPVVQVVGVCKHPGLFDGDDHPISNGFTVTDGTGCAGAFRWAQIHDSNHSHNATFFWQTRSRPADGGMIATLPPG